MSSSSLFYLALLGLLCAAVYSHSTEHDSHENCVHDALNLADEMAKDAQGGLKCADKKTEHNKEKSKRKSSEEDEHSEEEHDHESFLKRSLHEAEDLTMKAAGTAQKIVQNPMVRTSSGFAGEVILQATKFIMNVVRAMSKDEV